MAQGEGFKHITVTAADEDDVVIVAGATQEDDSESEESVGARFIAPVPEPEPEPAPAEEPKQQPKPKPAAKSAAKPARKDDYRETTLEDLEGKPMPFAQKVTIIAAIVCIIGAVIYYFAFMR
ncbi:MAG: SURF2 Surfeit locus protein 2 [Eggerthellaceae bacterium]|nr:SURF2 Surfeit locus protein 2 [Eggerthellaceae bacterium]